MTIIIKGNFAPGTLALGPSGLFDGLPQKAAAPATPNTTLNTRPSQLAPAKLLQVLLDTNSGLMDAPRKLLAAGLDDTLKAIIQNSETTQHLINTLNNVAPFLPPKRLPVTA